MNLPARTRTNFMPRLLVKPGLSPRVRFTSSSWSGAAESGHDGTHARATATTHRTTSRECAGGMATSREQGVIAHHLADPDAEAAARKPTKFCRTACP